MIAKIWVVFPKQYITVNTNCYIDDKYDFMLQVSE